jgi:hypothetical protein
VESDEDVLWQEDVRESHEDVQRRGLECLHVRLGKDQQLLGSTCLALLSSLAGVPESTPRPSTLQYLMSRPERELAVVTHGGFLFHSLHSLTGHLSGPAMMELNRW